MTITSSDTNLIVIKEEVLVVEIPEEEIGAHGSFLTVQDTDDQEVNLYLEDSGGSGRPIVFIHGWPLSGAAWDPQIDDFIEAGYRVITYDRRGFGRSDKPESGYDYDRLADDLAAIIDKLQLEDATLIGFSMGGGEVARYVSKYGTEHLNSVIFASAVTPYLAQTNENPQGPLDGATAEAMADELTSDRDGFFEDFIRNFYSVNGEPVVSAFEIEEGIDLAQQSAQNAALAAMKSFGTTDFREDLTKVDVPALIIHGDSDAVVPFEGSGSLTHDAIIDSELVLIDHAPHGVPTSHSEEWNMAVLDFLRRNEETD